LEYVPAAQLALRRACCNGVLACRTCDAGGKPMYRLLARPCCTASAGRSVGVVRQVHALHHGVNNSRYCTCAQVLVNHEHTGDVTVEVVISDHGLLPMYVADTVLSDNAAEAVPAQTAPPFTLNSYSFVDARYRTTTVSHESCTITPVALQITILDAPFTRSLFKSAVESNLAKFRLFMGLVLGWPLPRSMIPSQLPAVPV
jgi:hypothetical protein